MSNGELRVQSVKDILGSKYNGDMQAAFPDVDPGILPFGYLLVVQIRTPRPKIGSIILIDDTKEAEKWRVQTGLVRSVGPAAFRRRDTLEPWKEGDWCKVGQFVRCPMYGGDRWEVKIPGTKTDEKAIFMCVKDTDLIGLVTVDPMNLITS